MAVVPDDSYPGNDSIVDGHVVDSEEQTKDETEQEHFLKESCKATFNKVGRFTTDAIQRYHRRINGDGLKIYNLTRDLYSEQLATNIEGRNGVAKTLVESFYSYAATRFRLLESGDVLDDSDMQELQRMLVKLETGIQVLNALAGEGVTVPTLFDEAYEAAQSLNERLRKKREESLDYRSSDDIPNDESRTMSIADDFS